METWSLSSEAVHSLRREAETALLTFHQLHSDTLN